jgi:transcriptional regulator with XRE-family HTH domain
MTATQETTGWIPSTADFGARLALVRNHVRLNVKQAAAKAGVDDSSWMAWETKGTRPREMVSVAQKISEAFGCDLFWLLTGNAGQAKPTLPYIRAYLRTLRSGVPSGLLATPGLLPAA